MNRNRGEAAKALKAMGPVAEAGAIECLKTSPNGWVNKEVSGVLAEIGREQGLAALQEFLPKAKAGFDRQDAEKAIDAIRRRLRASP
jgi:HEAT repeat protein